MTRTQITLCGDDTDQFEAIRADLADRLPGSEASNAEVVRILMDAYQDTDALPFPVTD